MCNIFRQGRQTCHCGLEYLCEDSQGYRYHLIIWIMYASACLSVQTFPQSTNQKISRPRRSMSVETSQPKLQQNIKHIKYVVQIHHASDSAQSYNSQYFLHISDNLRFNIAEVKQKNHSGSRECELSISTSLLNQI